MALLFLPNFLRALRGKQNAPPTILPIGRERSLEQVENELCTLKRALRESRKAAGEAFATAAELRCRLNDSRAERVEMLGKIAGYDGLVVSKQKQIGCLRAECGQLDNEVVRLKAELREKSDALEQIVADLSEGVNVMQAERLVLEPLPDGPAVVTQPFFTCGFVARSALGGRIGVALGSDSRPLLDRVVQAILPRLEDVRLATDEIRIEHGSEGKS